MIALEKEGKRKKKKKGEENLKKKQNKNSISPMAYVLFDLYGV